MNLSILVNGYEKREELARCSIQEKIAGKRC